MKKLTVWALLATLVVAGSAFAAPGQIAANATFAAGAPTTTNNDDSCDIGVAPAATLLLPYFEVDLDNPAGETTIFTVTNVTNVPQIAHVTLWTDYTVPVIDFNIFLTGYDVQSINLFDVISRGIIAPVGNTGGTSSTNTTLSPRGPLSAATNPLITSTAACANLPGQIPPAYVQRMQQAFTQGSFGALGGFPGCATAGRQHENAVGYATIDVARVCGTGLPTDPRYFENEIGFENALVGDYQQVNSTQNFAQGNPMVHIRAIPEAAGPTNLPRTFYNRFSGGIDNRQPLPSRFAARWISGGGTDFETDYKIWREGVTDENVTCGNAPQNVTAITEMLTFDERENPFANAPQQIIISPPPVGETFALPETSRTSFAPTAGGDNVFAQPTNGAVGGWVYMNLDNDQTDAVASQNWVVVSMRAEGRYSVDFDAAWLGNGCSPQVGVSAGTQAGGVTIGPSPNVTP